MSPYKIIHNVETGQIVEVELTQTELAEAAATTTKAEAEAQAKAEAASAKAALLEKLGITEEEAKLLLS